MLNPVTTNGQQVILTVFSMIISCDLYYIFDM